MAISKAMRAALKALSYPDINIKKNYLIKRQLEVAAGRKAGLFYKPWDHVVDSGDHRIPVRLFAPEVRDDGLRPAILLFFHGGGWVTGNIDSYDKVCHVMAKKTSCVVVSVDYRLAPEHPFPAGAEDCYTVAKLLYSDASLFDMPPERIVMIGDSAGANLAAAVSLMARDRGEFLPTRQILIYPAVYNDHTETSPFPSVRENGTDYLLTSKRICDYLALYQGRDADRFDPYFAPLLAEDFSRQPDSLIITAEYDPLRDEGEAYAKRLREAGNRVTMRRMHDALHGFLALPPRFPAVKKTYELINGFLRRDEL